jgi:hypothetical protein
MNWLDFVGRILERATSSWDKFLMHLVLLAAFFVGLGLVAHAVSGVSPWVAAVAGPVSGAAGGSAAYARRRAVKAVKNGETKLA